MSRPCAATARRSSTPSREEQQASERMQRWLREKRGRAKREESVEAAPAAAAHRDEALAHGLLVVPAEGLVHLVLQPALERNHHLPSTHTHARTHGKHALSRCPPAGVARPPPPRLHVLLARGSRRQRRRRPSACSPPPAVAAFGAGPGSCAAAWRPASWPRPPGAAPPPARPPAPPPAPAHAAHAARRAHAQQHVI